MRLVVFVWLRVGHTQPDGLLADVRLRNQEITTRSTAKLQKFAVPKRTESHQRYSGREWQSECPGCIITLKRSRRSCSQSEVEQRIKF